MLVGTQEAERPAKLDSAIVAALSDPIRIRSNVIWNFLGLCAPLLLGVFVVPKLLSILGAEAVGLLALCWSLVGYLSFFDLGLGRALSQVAAGHLATGHREGVSNSFWTSLLLMAVVGIIGAIAVIVSAGTLASYIATAESRLREDGLHCAYLVGAAIPVLTIGAALRGFLEAHQRFAVVSAVRMGIGFLTFLGPLVTLPYSHRVAPMVGFLILARLGALFLYLTLSLRILPFVPRVKDIDWSTGWSLLRLGGWMTVSNVISPLMTYLDRFIIAGVLSLNAVAFYATPFEIATKLLLIPGALTGVLFPAFSGLLTANRRSADVLYRKGLAATALFLLPPTVLMFFFAKQGLTFWLGADFARNSQHVLQILALGVFANGIAALPFSLIQAGGRPQVTAVLHLIELPAYVAGCWYLTGHLGVDGAALAWTTRVAIDGAILLLIARSWNGGRETLLGSSAVLESQGTLRA